MRCETCQRPWLTKEQHNNLWEWFLFPICILGVFFAGALVESIAQFNLIEALLWIVGYAIVTTLVLTWYHTKVKD